MKQKTHRIITIIALLLIPVSIYLQFFLPSTEIETGTYSCENFIMEDYELIPNDCSEIMEEITHPLEIVGGLMAVILSVILLISIIKGGWKDEKQRRS